MNWLPHFSSGTLAFAGLICATGPVLIHLLNRRRFRLIEWAAMEFLFEALQRQRRRLRLRDLILLLLRTVAVLLFGLALARPYFSSDGSLVDVNSPRHLILLIDNSLSMGYRPVATSLLDQARQQARELIGSLPDGSQVSLAATCGPTDYLRGPLRRKADALELLQTIQVVDGVSRIESVVAAARELLGAASPLADQIVLYTDLQRNSWPTEIDRSLFAQLPQLHIRDLSVERWDNCSLADVRVRDDIVDLDMPATVFATIRHCGPNARQTQVTLTIAEQIVATRRVEFPPGESERQVAFDCSFADAPVEPGQATFVPVRVSLVPDRLELDDERCIMIPVVASLPVVFVDQYADAEEDTALGRLGETRPLRHLLAPRSTRNVRRPLVDIEHVTVGDVDRSLLSTARLVVIAGTTDPGSIVQLLQEYVHQGGPLVIAAGGDFDTVAWNTAAWEGEHRILPGRLAEEPLGVAPGEAGETTIEPFALSFDSLVTDPLLRLPGLSEDELREVYSEPLFFKAIAVDLQTSTRLPARRMEGQSRNRRSHADWLAWKSPSLNVEATAADRQSLQEGKNTAEVCARFTNEQGSPWLVRHRVGKGQVLFVSSSILPSWNNLAQTNAVVLWDHVLRSLIRSTMPQRNFTPQSRLLVPVPERDRATKVRLKGPGSGPSMDVLDIGFIETDQLGVTIPSAWNRGVYRLEPVERDVANAGTFTGSWRQEITVNGEAGESDLTPLEREKVRQTVIDPELGRFFDGVTLGAISGIGRGSAIWWWFILIVFALLIVELALLAAGSVAPPSKQNDRKQQGQAA